MRRVPRPPSASGYGTVLQGVSGATTEWANGPGPACLCGGTGRAAALPRRCVPARAGRRVRRGALAAVARGRPKAIEKSDELAGRKIRDGEKSTRPRGAGADPKVGVDIYGATSSAGGGLQVMVAGVVQSMTAGSAQRCAPGAGAI